MGYREDNTEVACVNQAMGGPLKSQEEVGGKTVSSSPEVMTSQRQSWWIDTGWACGGLDTVDGVVVDGPPIFRKFFGKKISHLQAIYKVSGPIGGV